MSRSKIGRGGCLALVLGAACAAAAQAGPPDIALPGEGPQLSLSQQNYASEGYADRSRVNAAHAGAHAMALSEEGPDDSAVGLVIDPISGEQLEPKPRAKPKSDH